MLPEAALLNWRWRCSGRELAIWVSGVWYQRLGYQERGGHFVSKCSEIIRGGSGRGLAFLLGLRSGTLPLIQSFLEAYREVYCYVKI